MHRNSTVHSQLDEVLGAPRALRAVVADDDPEMLDLVATTLRGAHFMVSEATDGAELLKLVADGPPVDVIVTDVNMPMVSGLQVLSRLRTILPGVPVILMTAFASASLCNKARYDGPAAAVLSKPFAMSALREVVSQHVPTGAARGANVAPDGTRQG